MCTSCLQAALCFVDSVVQLTRKEKQTFSEVTLSQATILCSIGVGEGLKSKERGMIKEAIHFV